MAELYIVGQAPSRLGDSRPFSGPSGQRLQRLGGFSSYEQMALRVNLLNLLDKPEERLRGARGDHFDYDIAKAEATRLMGHWHIFYPEVHVLAAGHKVFKCFTSRDRKLFQGVSISHREYHSTVKVWLFPHPSGASAFWNDPDNVKQAKRFLRARLRDAASSPT